MQLDSLDFDILAKNCGERLNPSTKIIKVLRDLQGKSSDSTLSVILVTLYD